MSTNAPEPTILLVGAGGMLGRAWQALLTQRSLPFEAVDYPRFDLTDRAAVERTLQRRHRLVVNCAAWTDVDGAESPEHFPAALAINATGVEYLAQRCRDLDATLLHYSTDYVFNGQAATPYPPDAPREPVNAYGRTKAAGEVAIEQAGCRYLLVRTSWLYAPWGKNFVLTMARLTRDKSALRVVDDQRGRPTSAEHLATASLELHQRGATGAYHVTDGGACTWCELSRQINEQLGHACDVQPCTTAEFPRPAKRPTYSVLDLTGTEALLGPMPDWRDNLRGVLQRLTVGDAQRGDTEAVEARGEKT